ncbi:MAG TPA: hypothetical protein VFT82_03815 [Candidatus Paceibacterota bacterium]|nr:hypothetical protein [Candidatus Paceibacterota bacterium]
MRDILKHLPKELAADRMVLLVGHENEAGIGGLKSHISELNRREEWIRAEFKSDVSAQRISARIGLILVMGGVTTGSIKNIRDAASKLGIPCPFMPFTIGEAKYALSVMQERRKKTGEPLVKAGNGTDQNGEQNGYGTNGHRLNGSQPNGSTSGIEPVAAIPETAAIALANGSDGGEDELLKAFDLLDGMTRTLQGSQDALFRVIERCKAADARCRELEEQMRNKDRDYALVQEENVRLKADNAKYRNFVAQFKNLGDTISK